MAISWPALILALAALVLAVLLWAPLHIEVTYRRVPGSWGTGLVVLHFLGILRWRRRLQVRNQADRAVQAWLQTRRKAPGPSLPPSRWQRLGSVALPRLLAALRVREAALSLDVAAGDAARTAIAVGALWGLIGGAFGYALSQVRRRPARPRLSIRPDFKNPGWQLSVDMRCIVEVRPGHIIAALLASAGSLVMKGGRGRERSSYSGTDEDGHGKHQGHG